MVELPRGARTYVGVVLLGGAASAALSLLGPLTTSSQGMLTISFALLACLAQFFDLRSVGRQRQAVTLAFLVAAAVLLPAVGLVVVAVVPFAVDQAARPRAWYVAAFETANHLIATVLAGVAARAVLQAYGGNSNGLSPAHSPGSMAVAGLCAAVILLVLTHASLVRVLQLSGGAEVGDSGLFHLESLFTDASLLSIGIAAALLWHAAPVLTVFLVLPLLLVQRGLRFPQLQDESRRDAKTGLWNAGYLREIGETEVRRSIRTRSACSVLVADLDLLRDINNTYGHLAGDAVLAGVAQILQDEVREYDLVARFGGEEFVVLLPETQHRAACVIAERIRARIAETPFEVPTSAVPLTATLSLGVSTTPEHGATLDALMHRADLALYRAKEAGRNRVAGADASDDSSTAPTVESRPARADGDGPTTVIVMPELDSPAHAVAREDGTEAPAARKLSVEAPSAFDLPVRTGVHAMRSRSSWRLTVPVLIACAAGAFLLLFSAVGFDLFHNQPEPLPFVLFPLLATAAAVVSRATSMRMPDRLLMLPAAVVLAAVHTGRPLTACATAAAATLVGAAAQRRSFEEAIYRLGVWELAAAAAFAARHEFLASNHAPSLSLLIAMLIAAPLFVSIERALTCLWASRQRTGSWRGLVWMGYVRSVHTALGAAIGATVLGRAYSAYGWGAEILVVAALALVVTLVAHLEYRMRPPHPTDTGRASSRQPGTGHDTQEPVQTPAEVA